MHRGHEGWLLAVGTETHPTDNERATDVGFPEYASARNVLDGARVSAICHQVTARASMAIFCTTTCCFDPQV